MRKSFIQTSPATLSVMRAETTLTQSGGFTDSVDIANYKSSFYSPKHIHNTQNTLKANYMKTRHTAKLGRKSGVTGD